MNMNDKALTEILWRLHLLETRQFSDQQTEFDPKVETRISALEEKVIRIDQHIQNIEEFEESLVPTAITKMSRRVTGVVGLRETVSSKYRLARFVWGVLFVLGVFTTIFVIYRSTVEYLDEPTATKIKLNVSTAYDIPPIAFCPAAWMDAEAALEMGMNMDGFKYSLGYVDTYSGIRIKNLTKAKEDFLNFYKKQNYSSLLDYYKAITIDLSIVYSSDAYRNQTNAIKLSDNRTATVEKIFVSFEMCYAYISTQNSRSLYTKANAAVKFLDQTKEMGNVPSGLWVQLVTDLDFQNTLFPPIYAPTFTQNKILVGSQRFVTLNRPDAPCLESDTVPDRYDSFSCAVECQNRLYGETVKCKLFRYSTVSGVEPPMQYCHQLEKLPARNVKLSEFKSSPENDNITQLCLKECPNRCDRITYQTMLQWQTFIEDDGREREQHKTNTSEGKKTMVEVLIEHRATYEGGTMALLEVNTYSFIELISNVGGTLGLFVGATLMTFVQLIGFCIEWIFEVLWRKWKCGRVKHCGDIHV